MRRLPLMKIAVSGGNSKFAKLLIDAGADVNAEDENEESRSIMKAAQYYGNVEVVNLLRQAGAAHRPMAWFSPFDDKVVMI
jgi:ankyrin repeat protein